MRVHPSQLTVGCILLKDVRGKSGHPLMKENTILTDEHITILQKFLIDAVEISSRQSDGKIPALKKKKQEKESTTDEDKNLGEMNSFAEQYLQAVSRFEKEFNQWNNGMPIDISIVRQFIIPLLERMDEQDIDVFTLAKFGNADTYIYHHSVAMSIISAFLAKEMGYSKGEWLQIGLAGLLSNAGMTRIDSDIIRQAAPLTRKQQEDIRNHPTYSLRMVEHLPAISPVVKLAIVQHHERMDGSGYPLELTKEKMSKEAQILAISDTYHAMTSERLYQEKQSVFKVIEELQKQKYSRFDTEVIHTFIKSFCDYSLGKSVRLSNHSTGEIVFSNEKYPTKPLIKLHTTKEVISLQENPTIYIEDFLLF